MDYGGLVKRALEIMWKFKYLWIFGFFLEFGSGGGGWVGNLPEKIKLPVGDFLSGALVGAIILLVLVGLVVFVLFLIMYIISQGGLIHCVWKIQSGENPTLRDGWNAGVKNFWRILGISIMILIFILVSALFTLAPFILLLITFKALGIISAIILFPLFLVLFITIILINLYATRTCIIEGKGVFASLAEGWEMLKTNLGPSLVVGLIGIGSTMVYIFGFVAVGLLLALPFIALGIFNLFLGIFLGVVVGLIYIGVLSAIWGTYIDSLWTLAYLDMKKLQLQNVAV
ncbi:MAG: hypothetical protein AMJ91_07335 [candidate division Zixibacteria bacterium SM23_73_3]|nr:MAG: hypothetical protein AMJ91_07335 [candidate division Zixibacteria bacterium SM23_73_3]